MRVWKKSAEAVLARKYWGVESNNWIPDVTLNEDHIQTKAGN